jgi:hypothetical protein
MAVEDHRGHNLCRVFGLSKLSDVCSLVSPVSRVLCSTLDGKIIKTYKLSLVRPANIMSHPLLMAARRPGKTQLFHVGGIDEHLISLILLAQ